MFCYGLWNSTETAVAYNRELLGLSAQINQGNIQRENGQKQFHFADETGGLLFEGVVREATKASLQVGWSLLRQGVRPFLERLFESPANLDGPDDHGCGANDGDGHDHHGHHHHHDHGTGKDEAPVTADRD